jgi:hypothetical protein
VLFAAIEHQADGGAGLAREVDGEQPKLPMPYLAPNPPPVNSLITRTLLLGSAKISAASSRTLAVN